MKKILPKLWGVTTGICLLILTGCLPTRVLLSPVPDRIERMEGYASLSLTGEEGSARSNFSFLFSLPDKGHIEVREFIIGSLYQIIITDGTAYFILPKKKVYWEGEEEEIIDKFLGFRLNLEEMISLFTGKWPAPIEGEETVSAWQLDRDSRGRILSGRREDLRFKVESFIEDTRLAQSFIFEHPASYGRLKFSHIDFNRPYNERAFSTAFQKRYQRKTWEEIQALLNDAD